MAARTKPQVIYSELESTIHVKQGEEEVFPDGTVHQAHSSKVLLPGDTIGLDEVPSYMVELIKEKKAPGLILLDQVEADKLNEFAKLVRGQAKPSDFAAVTTDGPEFPEPLVGSEPIA